MKKENRFFRFIKQAASSRFNTRWLSGILHQIDKPFIALSGGRTSLSSILTGLPFAILISKGAKSGQLRRSPLFCIIDGDKFILVASSFGRKRNPGWYYNLRANPKAKLIYMGESGDYIARETDGEERESYWQQTVRNYSGYGNYAEWASHRKIPILVLEPYTE